MTRVAMNFAQLLGPMVGGAIYQAGGFYLPFLTMGSLQVCMGIVCFLCLPRESVSSADAQSRKKLSILKVLRIPTIWFSFMGFIVATVCNGFLSINLEPQVSEICSVKSAFRHFTRNSHASLVLYLKVNLCNFYCLTVKNVTNSDEIFEIS